MKKICYRIDYYDSKKDYSQKFTYEENEYKLDPEIHKLVVVGKKDLQEQLNSYLDQTFIAMLQRFLQPSLPVNFCDTRRTHVDLIKLGEAIETANIYREKYGLTDVKYENPQEVFKYLNEMSKNVNKEMSDKEKWTPKRKPDFTEMNKIFTDYLKKEENINEKKIINEEVKKDI